MIAAPAQLIICGFRADNNAFNIKQQCYLEMQLLTKRVYVQLANTLIKLKDHAKVAYQIVNHVKVVQLAKLAILIII